MIAGSNCENCGSPHDGSFASGRFCCRGCAASFCTKAKRAEISAKVAAKLKGRQWGKPFTKGDSRRKDWRQHVEYRISQEPWDSLSHHYRKLRILREQNSECLCGVKDWNSKKLTLQLDHIDGDKHNNSRKNLRMLCPNCHSQTDTWCRRKSSVRSTDRTPLF